LLCISYCLLCLLFNKIREHEEGKGSAWQQGGRGWGQGEDVAQTMYTPMNKCKNNLKIKKINKIKE
jgi:hypothetical protein